MHNLARQGGVWSPPPCPPVPAAASSICPRPTRERSPRRGPLPADAIIIDLEDSVAPDLKPAARAAAVEAIKAGGFGGREVVLRINGAHTPWGADDLEAAIAAAPDAVLLPKVDGPGTIMVAARAMNEAGAPAQHPAVGDDRDADGDPLAPARSPPPPPIPISRLEVLVMGLNDLVKETRARLTPGRPAAIAWLSMCVAAARAHGCDIVDGVYNDFNDPVGFQAECEQGRDLGLDGKTLIHPSQIDVCNATFAPTAGRDRDGARDHRRLRAAGELRPGRDPARRQDGRAAARGDGAAHARRRRGHRGADGATG